MTDSTAEPVLFLSHGAGPCWYIDASKDSNFDMLKELDMHSKSAQFMKDLQSVAGLPKKPRALLVVSAHWEEVDHAITTSKHPTLYFDYYGFPDQTYKIKWSVPGEPGMAKTVQEQLQFCGIPCVEDAKRGLDHGVFVPLKLAYPKADVPVVQLSLKKNLSISDHLLLGEALQPLRKQGILIIGSGQSTHSGGMSKDGIVPEWCQKFTKWFHDVLTNSTYSPIERKQLLQESAKEPTFHVAHPRIEHFLPSVVACAAAGYSPGKVLYEEVVFGKMLMSTVKFE